MNRSEFSHAPQSRRPFATLVLLVAGLLLGGCEVELYSDLDETDANEIISVLARYDIRGSKGHQRGGAFSVELEESDIGAAVDILRMHGLPRKRFQSMGELFRKKGLISSPLEERARFVFALQETLQETLSQIDGVIVARVHVVVPENNPFADGADKASSASVFIKHADDHDLGQLRSEIKMIVGNSIEGLTYRDVTVTLVPSRNDLGTNRSELRLAAAHDAGVGPSAVSVTLSIAFVLVGLWLTRGRVHAWLAARSDRHEIARTGSPT